MTEKKNAEAGIDKSFNDSELEDIMNEIESLEKEFVSDTDDTDASALEIKEEDVTPNDYQQEIDGKLDSQPETHTSEEIVDEVEVPTIEEPTMTEVEEPTMTEVEEPVVDEVEVPTAVVEEVVDKEEVIDEKIEEIVDNLDGNEENSAKIEDKLEAIENSIEESDMDEPTLKKEDAPQMEKVVETHDNVVPFAVSKVESDTSSTTDQSEMNFSVSGNMDLHLNLTVGGKSVKLYINESEGLTIEAEGGMKFTIPLTGQGQISHKKAI